MLKQRDLLVLRLRLVCLCLLAVLFTVNNAAQAQSLVLSESTQPYFTLHPDTTHQELKPQQEIQEEKLSPFLKTAGIVVAGAAVWTATYMYVDEPLQRFTQSHRNAVANGMAQVVTPLGRQKYLMPAAGAALLGGLLAKDEKLQQVGLISVGSILVNAGITSTLKKTFHRHRPNITTDNDVFDGPFNHTSNASLPSSHTSTAFAVATSVATVYKDSKYVPPIAYGIASLVGLARINDNAHWTTDVMAAAAVGYLSSKGVSYLYNLADEKLEKRRQKLLLTPQIGLTSAGFSGILIF
ncbi:phosphatase PAP2 family protein [Pontibacter sp. 172403-2]|uniref:phosphatase PAP2 family protein n=1 Tax=Pontibacter rufus TaxID=2791028 RepID=UPI0018AFEC76|nr:phosphatase PAP2 family protein [Pontibacter sp. 172403-2]MBF9252237.1 phosphatase PAP2 family protein [Pontibacter sp. 172403-2]